MDTAWTRKTAILASALCLAISAVATAGAAAGGPVKAGTAAERVAGMSDEEARKLLLDTLQAQPPEAGKVTGGIPGDRALDSLLATLGRESSTQQEKLRELASHIPESIADLGRAFRSIGPSRTAGEAWQTLLLVLCFIGIGFAAELAFRRLLRKKYSHYFAGNDAAGSEVAGEPAGGGKPTGMLLSALPPVLGLLVFIVVAYFSYFAFVWAASPGLTLIFFAALLAIGLVRLIAVIAGVILSPASRVGRLLPIGDSSVTTGYRLTVLATGYIVTALMTIVVVQRLGALPETVAVLKLAAATLLLLSTAAATVRYRREAAAAFFPPLPEGTEPSEGRQVLAATWHYLALLYLVVLWGIMILNIVGENTTARGAFLLSFFVLPIWLAIDRAVQWLTRQVMRSLRLEDRPPDSQPTAGPESDGTPQAGAAPPAGELLPKVIRLVRRAVFVGVLLWIAGLWGYTIPFVTELSGVLFDALLVITLALLFWRIVSGWIEMKIVESRPEVAEKRDDVDDEWGDVAAQGRSYTLLPIIRSFIASILVVMVILTILSSLGVDIGPLLAGAGVVGLAVGFGAQKIVSDIFSGVFYLLDDAFRVGEYLTAGGIMGTVERITLRNVMLRHHRGMLQIVPYSQLGTITNYMRGGIIEKFNLDFPYDADIDKIRKIIKKVGQEMVEDPELGKNFIRPLKSQGVREIANSVMTIRVKFTAKPGTQFVIRREAFRRITAAMQARGIQYAHRKVIVDLPSAAAPDHEDPDRRQQLAKAAGAAARQIFDEEEKLKEQLAQEKSKA